MTYYITRPTEKFTIFVSNNTLQQVKKYNINQINDRDDLVVTNAFHMSDQDYKRFYNEIKKEPEDYEVNQQILKYSRGGNIHIRIMSYENTDAKDNYCNYHFIPQNIIIEQIYNRIVSHPRFDKIIHKFSKKTEDTQITTQIAKAKDILDIIHDIRRTEDLTTTEINNLNNATKNLCQYKNDQYCVILKR